MAVDVKNLIAAINPKVYCEEFKDEYGVRVELRKEVEKLAKEKGYLKAAERAKLIESQFMEFDEYEDKSTYYADPFNCVGLKNPVEKHTLVYDAFGESLEPIYFWLIDNLQNEYKDMKKIDKLIDNFVASPGSGFFSEMGGKATKMQEEAMKMLGAANQVIKSILNLVYDLKEMKMRLQLYKRCNSKDKNEKSSALLSLKQLWMDTVDMKRGNSAIKAMAQQFQFVTMIDAFMAADTLEDLDPKNDKSLDLNDRVRRILQQRLGEFLDWLELSEKELTKRYEIEKIYLKSQLNSIKLYARWVKPYLKAAKALEQNATGQSEALVTSFNTAVFELVLLGESEYKPDDDVKKGDLPQMVLRAKRRDYAPVIIVGLSFRSAPERTQQGGYGFRGRIEISFTSFALNNDELRVLREEVEKDDFGDVFKALEGATRESLEQIQVDIDELLEEKKDEKKEEDEEDTNPFSALWSFFKSDKKKEEEKNGKNGKKEIEPDNDIEKVIRSLAIIKARTECRKIYDLYKKAHNMPAM